jgi:hypothetical protein
MNRVLAALGLAVAVGVAAIWIEGYQLRLRQRVSELHQQRDMLAEELSRRRLAVSEMVAPPRLIERLDLRNAGLEAPQFPVSDLPRPNPRPIVP